MMRITAERRAALYIQDILKYSHLAIEFLGDQSDAQLESDLKTQFAIIRSLEVIGEAARCIPEEIRLLAPNVPWQEVIAMRNRIVHHYFGVRLDIVLNVVRNDLGPLNKTMEDLLVILLDRQN